VGADIPSFMITATIAPLSQNLICILSKTLSKREGEFSKDPEN
jgi:hypothetical protein